MYENCSVCRTYDYNMEEADEYVMVMEVPNVPLDAQVRYPVQVTEEGEDLYLKSELVVNKKHFRPPVDFNGREAYKKADITMQVEEREDTFADLVSVVCQHLMTSQVSVDRIKVYITNLSVNYKEDMSTDPRVFSEHQTEVIKHSELPRVFEQLSTNGYWSFLNYYLLERLVKRFGNEDLERRMEDYTKKIDEFKQSIKLADFLPVWSGRTKHISDSDVQPLILKVNEKWESCTLADISNMEGYLQSRFLLNRFLLKFANAIPGSVIIMWLVPKHVMAYLRERVNEAVQASTSLEMSENKIAIKVSTFNVRIPKAVCSPKESSSKPDTTFKTISTKTLLDFGDFDKLCQTSIKDPDFFWGTLANQFLHFDKPFKKVMDCDMEEGKNKWFTGGKLNVSVNCVDRYAELDPERVALIWETNQLGQHKDTVTYKELLEMVCQIANVLREKLGVKKGDIVAIYMSKSPITIASMLACARIGAVHSVLFSRYGPKLDVTYAREKESQAIDLDDIIARAKVVITANEIPRQGKKPLHLKKRLDDLIKNKKLDNVQYVLVSQRTCTEVDMVEGRDIWLEEAMEKEPKTCKPELMDSEDDLFILSTSGTSGPPKGIVHTQAGYLLYVATTFKYYFDCKSGDVFACIADIGWITGHSYVVYGPLCNGATTVLFDNAAALIDPSCYWRMIEKVGVTKFYTTPSMIRKVMGHDRQSASHFEMPSLKLIAFVGEPLSKDARNWCFESVGKGRCHLLDTWWQTELGGICMATPLHPTTSESGMKPSFGVEPLVYNEQNELDVTGKLFLKNPLPGMGRRLLGDDGEQRFKELYFKYIDGKHLYYTSDVVHVKFDLSNNGYQVVGREEDVIKLGDTHLNIPFIEGEAAAIHKDIMEVVVTAPKGRDSVFLCVHAAVKDLKCVSAPIEEKIEKFFWRNFEIPVHVKLTQELKKTYSGKIIRYILRDVEENFHPELGTGDVDAAVLHVKRLGFKAAADYGVEDYLYY